jgi:hypothetical protein
VTWRIFMAGSLFGRSAMSGASDLSCLRQMSAFVVNVG